MKILTFRGARAHEVDVCCGSRFQLSSRIFLYPLDNKKTLVIDSWNNLIDLVPNTALDASGRTCTIVDRYFPKTDDPSNELAVMTIGCEVEERRRGINVISLCPTFSCNLACTYCFERSFSLEKAVGMRSDAMSMLREAAAFISASKACYPDNPTAIELFGGEPLQTRNRDFVAEVLAFARKQDVGVSVVTNGYDLLAFVDLFVLYRDVLKSVSLTIDGPRSIHDSVRITHGGTGTFDKIVRSVNAMVDLKLPIRVCTNVSSLSIDYLSELIDFVEHNGWYRCHTFQMEIGRVYDRYSSGFEGLVYEYQIQEKLIELFGENKPDWLISGFMKSTEYPSKLLGVDFGQNEYGKARFSYCWATSNIIRGYYLGPARDRYRCTTTVGNKAYQLDLPDDRLPVDTSGEWMASLESRPDKCLNCPIGGYCNGGCRVERLNKSQEEICSYELTNFRLFVERIAIPRIKKILQSSNGGE